MKTEYAAIVKAHRSLSMAQGFAVAWRFVVRELLGRFGEFLVIGCNCLLLQPFPRLVRDGKWRGSPFLSCGLWVWGLVEIVVPWERYLCAKKKMERV